MELLNNYRIHFCGKCSEGYVKSILPSGEETLSICECKLKNDEKFIYNSLIKNSNLQYITFGEYSFENTEKFVEKILVDKYSPQMYEGIFNNFFKTTSTRLVAIPQFIKFLYGVDLNHANLNLLFINSAGSNLGTHFFNHFVLNVLLKRLVPAKLLSFSEFQSHYMDYKKYDIETFTKGVSCMLLTQFFCDDMIDSMKTDFKYERLNKALFELYNLPDFHLYISADKYIGMLRNLHINEKIVSDRILSNRVNSILDLILNKSRTVITQIPEK